MAGFPSSPQIYFPSHFDTSSFAYQTDPSLHDPASHNSITLPSREITAEFMNWNLRTLLYTASPRLPGEVVDHRAGWNVDELQVTALNILVRYILKGINQAGATDN